MWYGDNETIRRARDGSIFDAYRLYEANFQLIRKIAKRYSHIDPAVALDDLLQEGWLAVQSAVQLYDPQRGTWQQALAWACQSQFRGCLHVRRKRPQQILSLDQTAPEDETVRLSDGLADPTENAELPALREDFRDCVRRSVMRLTPDKRAAVVIIRCDVEGEDMHSVADAMGLAFGTIAKLRRMALLQLRKCPAMLQLQRDAAEIDSATFHASAETCAMLMLKTRRRSWNTDSTIPSEK